MKFTNGYWMVRDGVTQTAPKQVYDYRIDGDKLTLFAPTAKIFNKGSTLNSPLITIEMSSPMEDVIRVRAYRHKGANKKTPSFEINELKPTVSIEISDEEITFKTGRTTAVISRCDEFSIRYYYDRRLLTSSLANGLAHMMADGKAYMKEELSLGVGESVYGLGERFTAFVKNGQTVDIWNDDGGTCSEQSYKNIPFYLTTNGYGVLVNQPERVSYEIASEKVNRAQFCVEGESIEYFIIGAENMKGVISRYTDLSGKPSLPPAWSFGLWLSTSFVTDYDEDTVMEFIDEMLERKIPLDVFHFDCCWMEEYEWCNFTWNKKVFPNPKQMLAKIHERGLKTCVWINSYIGQKSPLFDEGMENGYFVKNPDGSVWQWDLWQAGMALVDFTNPAATAWYQSKLETLMDMGVDCFKTDFGERIPTDVVYFDGSDPQKMHNYYTYLYNEAVFDLLKRKRGENEAVLFARSATVGGQKFPVHWGGDCTSEYTSMAETLRGGLSFAMSGFGFWSHDIGGFEDGCQRDIYKRWTQFGLLSSHSRYHGSGEYKVPWLYGDEAAAVTKKFSELKVKLMPYLFNEAVKTTKTGVAMLRPMVLEFESDETSHGLDRQYMLGENLFVAPIFNCSGAVSYYLPAGKWTNLLTGEVHEGTRWYKETYDYFNMPLFARENSIIITGKNQSFAAYDYTKDVTINLFGFENDCMETQTVCDISGNEAATVTVISNNGKVSVSNEGLSGDITIILNGKEI